MQKKLLTCMLLAATLGCSAVVRTQPALTIEDANHAYYYGEFARSLVMYEQLAAGGNAEAAERAAFMLMQGDGLYGSQVRRNVAKAQPLLVQAAKANRPGAAFMLGMLDAAD